MITDKQLIYLSPPTDPRRRRFHVLPEIHKSANSKGVPGKISSGRPIVFYCNSETKMLLASLIITVNHRQRDTHPTQKAHDFAETISDSVIPDNYLLITSAFESRFTNIDHNKGLAAVSEAFRFHGHLCDGMM